MNTISFFVPGTPAPGGSKKFVGFGRHTGKAILVDAGGERNKNWRSSVAQCGHAEMRGANLLSGALHVRFEFVVARPKGHLNARGELRPAAPPAPITMPDTLKLARSTEDALTGVCWHDDAQTVLLNLEKRYARPGEGTGCRITILPLFVGIPENTTNARTVGGALPADDLLIP